MTLSNKPIATLQKKIVALSFCIFLSLLTYSSFAQSYYSVDPAYLKKRSEISPFNSAFTNYYPDTSIIKNHQFTGRNFLGNVGLSSPQYLLKFTSNTLGFKLFQTPLDDSKIKKENIDYFKTKGPFAELTGISGIKQLQLFKILFSNSFKNNLNITLKLNRYTSQGYYLKQLSSTSNFYVSGNYENKSKRFGFNTFILINNNKFQENGGVINDTIRKKDLLVPKNLIPVQISSATRDNRELTAMYGNWFKLNKNKEGENRLNSFLQLKSTFSSLKYKYKDQNSGTDNYYFLFYLDTAKTLDSTRIRNFNNEVNLSFQTNSKNLSFNIGYENEVSQLWQYSDTSFLNHLANANLTHFKSFISADSLRHNDLINTLSGSYIASGAFAGNYKVESFHAFHFYRNNKLKQSIHLKLLAEERAPDYIYKRWYSNHFVWENKFNNTQTVQAELALKIPMLQLTATYKGLTNYLYFDQLAYPVQHSGTIANSAINITFENVFFKHLGVRGSQTYQNSSSSVISLPNSISLGSLFYTGKLFKNNLQLTVGGQVEYYNQFRPYAYMPATQVFYIQDKFNAGNFTFVDVFLNARIKPVSLFVKMENVLHNMLGTNYSMVPGYYQPEMALRFGFTWLFFD